MDDAFGAAYTTCQNDRLPSVRKVVIGTGIELWLSGATVLKSWEGRLRSRYISDGPQERLLTGEPGRYLERKSLGWCFRVGGVDRKQPAAVIVLPAPAPVEVPELNRQ
jgi:hypothetical protein